MRKIQSLFQRNYETDRLVRDEVVPGSEWVLNGEGTATVKTDGTCCMIKDGELYKRYDAKHGKQPPEGFLPAQEPDSITGHWPGWLKVGDGKEDRWHREGFENLLEDKADGTYELVGPKVQGNKYDLTKHLLWKHGLALAFGNPRTFDEIKELLESIPIEGIVWHHLDGRMVKIKRKDFGLKW